MALYKKRRKKKRRLDPKEIEQIRQMYESSSQGRKPTIGQLAKVFGVNKPSIIKSLGGWKGIARGRPVPPPKQKYKNIIVDNVESPVIQGYTTEVNLPNV